MSFLMRKRSWMAVLLILGGILGAAEAEFAVVPAAPAAAFLTGEALRFDCRAEQRPERYHVEEWRGRTVIAESEWPADGTLTLAPLPEGYYALIPAGNEFSGRRTFAVVPDPGKRQRNPVMVYALDSAQNWLASPGSRRNNPRAPENPLEVMSEAAYRSGTSMVRERLAWGGSEARPGEYSWGNFGVSVDLLAARGVAVCVTFHDAPEWARVGNKKLPGAPDAVYRFCRKLAETFHGKVQTWEFWNEQDIGFASEPAWEYAAMLKAAFLGFRAGDPQLPVAIGGPAVLPLTPYNDVVMENGAAEYFDLFNIHSYQPLFNREKSVGNVCAFMERHRIGAAPIWVTEDGSRVEGLARAEGMMPGVKAHSPEQELLVAEFLPKAMLEHQLQGIARNFFFVLSPYNENSGSKDWGLLRRDFTVKPGFAAFAVLADRLGNAKMLGALDAPEGIRALLFENPDGSQTVVYWTRSALDEEGFRPDLKLDDFLEKEWVLPLPGGVEECRAYDVFGTPIPLPFRDGNLTLPANRFPAYLVGVSGLHPAQAAVAPPDATSLPQPGPGAQIVLRALLSESFVVNGKESADPGRDGGRLMLQVWNFSDAAQTVSLQSRGGLVDGLPDSVAVEPEQCVELPLRFRFDPSVPTPETRLCFTGSCGGESVSPVEIPIKSAQLAAELCRRMPLTGMMDPGGWKENSSGSISIDYDAAEGGVRFHTEFPPLVDRWSYPEYILQLPQESLENAYGLSFEVKMLPAGKSAITQMLVMASHRTGKTVFLPVLEPTSQWESRVVVFDPGSVKPEEIEMLRFGLNSRVDEITFLLRNVEVLYR